MRNLLYGAAALALATLTSPATLRSSLTASASSLFEAAPFLFAGVVLSHVVQRRAHIVEYLGCGCGGGASARSIPATAATWLVFGPFVAVARYLAALLVERLAHRNAGDCAMPVPSHPLGELTAVLPAALLAGAAMQIAARLDPARLSVVENALAGAALGFFAAPCGLGTVALAGALHVRAPVAAAAFLCVAGIADLRVLARARQVVIGHDAFAYALLAVALGIVGWRHGGGLVHPAFSIAFGCCACAAALGAFVHRHRRFAAARIAPALMLAGALVGAPPPPYRATETTLTDLFAGERLTFTGALARESNAATVVRYAITCCRADATPIAVRLTVPPPYTAGTWLRVEGTIQNAGGSLRLAAARIERVPAPADPFIYR
jgi:hypothetical protein